jgi:hypothetical protein
MPNLELRSSVLSTIDGQRREDSVTGNVRTA